MQNLKTFGPFTPQEFKNASAWLVKNNIEFTHFIDQEAEKRFAENSPENLVSRAELRTKTYLGSVFFIKADMNPSIEKSFKETTHLLEDVIPDKFKIAQIPESTHSQSAHLKKVIWARVLLVLAVAYAIFILTRK